MTSGPLTPPMVLYFSRGLMEVMRGSSIEGAIAGRGRLTSQGRGGRRPGEEPRSSVVHSNDIKELGGNKKCEIFVNSAR